MRSSGVFRKAAVALPAMPRLLLVLLWALWTWCGVAVGFPEQGKWSVKLSDKNEYVGVVKNLYNGTKIFIDVQCSSQETKEVVIGWVLRQTECWNEFAFLEFTPEAYAAYYQQPERVLFDKNGGNVGAGAESVNDTVSYVQLKETTYSCLQYMTLEPLSEKESGSLKTSETPSQQGTELDTSKESQYTVVGDGDYLLVVHIGGLREGHEVTVNIRMEGPHGYLSIVDFPLLPFYGTMCGFYVLMAMGWLVVSGMYWRDLLRIQFWIAGVAFLGMLEKAMFCAEFQTINSTGESTKGLILVAEFVSCAKRALARMLVIIVSLGFGIVKPRLGPTLHRILGVGLFYFSVSIAEAYMRVMKPKNDISSATMVVGIPLAVIDSFICWWVFSSLVETTRTLRLRRNLIKLSLYRKFTNVLIMAVLTSVVFMVWSIQFHRMEDCLKDWRDLWIDEAFWHVLFSILLLFIMTLWRPSKNNQRYAFTPLLDNEEDEEDEEEHEEPYYNDAFDGMKQRLIGLNGKQGKADQKEKADEDDPLKWVEENIPESAETENPLPVLDSDEELQSTRFEISKMQ